MFNQPKASLVAAWIERSSLVATLWLILLAGPSQAARPEPPALLSSIHLIEDEEFIHPYLPAFRTSNDGRVAIEVEDYYLKVYLLTPEKVDAPWHLSTPGTSRILSDQTPFQKFIRHYPDGKRGFSHQFLCETTSSFPEASDDTNPYACGDDGLNDCYDLTHGGWQGTDGDQPTRLWGTPMTVEVVNPKTPNARIVDVRLGTPVAGPLLPSPVFWEPMVTRDGRLLVGRLGYRTPLSWRNEHANTTETGSYDLAYSLLNEDAEDCDVRGWQQVKPIAYAPYDPDMQGKYGIAAFPLRTGQGEPVSETTVFGGTYPWVDRDGNNVFMTTLSTSLGSQASQYPHRCVPGEGCIDNDDTSRLKGVSVAGLWTQGRTVHIDNMLNNTDWGLPLDPAGHRMVTLYEQSDGTPVELRVGAGGRHKDTHYPALKGRTGNTAIIDSVENMFNHRREMQPRSPGDVVWLVSNGKATDEVVFDDYMNPDGFIISSMIASLRGRRLLYEDGRYGDIQIQNAAGALPDRWKTPGYGLVSEGTGRAEAVALGGIHGRGLWLDGSSEVSYNIESQPRNPKDSDWYVGIFVDSRFANDETRRNLIRYPDGTSLALQGRSHLVFLRDNGGTVINTISLPRVLPTQGWAHIALQLSDRNREVTVYHNGFAFNKFRINDGFFAITPGQLVIAGEAGTGRANGFRGWIDDFKIFAQQLNPEVACNQAMGTLIGIESNSNWQTVADRYPEEFHDSIDGKVSASGRGSYGRYACYTDYLSVHGIDVKRPPNGSVSVREAINFPEGPVVFNQPRPDSVNNAFCLSCHTAEGKGGLGLNALTFDPNVNAMDDPRRQPLQHLRMVHGNIPEGWLDGRITEASQAGPEGFMLDPHLLDRGTPPGNPTPVALSYTLRDRVWSLLTVPANTSSRTVRELFADDLPMSTYRQTWIIYTFDEQNQRYSVPVIDSSLNQGDGFWMVQMTGADVTIDLPSDVPDGSSQLTDICASSRGCFPVRIQTSSTASSWRLAGAPYASRIDTSKIRVASSNGTCVQGCDLDQAISAGLFLGNQWAFNSASGQYESISDTGFLQPWQGFWVLAAALPAEMEVTLLFPRPD